MTSIQPLRRHSSLREQALTEMRQAIIVGQLAGGALLSEQAIAERLHISRTPVREALLQLSAEGLVEFVPNRGVRITEPDAEQLAAVFELRASIEGYCARLLARQARARDVVSELTRALDEQRRIIAADDRVSWVAENMRFHLLLVERVGNRLMIETVRNLASHTMRIGYRMIERTQRMRESLDEHSLIVEAIRRGQPERARRCAEEHLAITTDLMRTMMLEPGVPQAAQRSADRAR